MLFSNEPVLNMSMDKMRRASARLSLGRSCIAQVNPDVKRRVPWTEGEDEKLRALIAKARAKRQAVSWADIARKLPGRSDQQVKGHWER